MDPSPKIDSLTEQAAVPSSAYPTNQQRRVLWTALTALAVMALLGVAALIFLGFITFLGWSYPILLPIGLAVIIALVLEPVVAFIQKRVLSRETATLLVCLLAVIGFLLFWFFLSRPLVDQAGRFFHNLPALINDSVDKLETSVASPLENPPPASPHVAVSSPANPPPPLPAPNQTANVPVVANRVPASLASRLRPWLNRPIGEPSKFQMWLKDNLPTIEETAQKNVANLIYSALGPVGHAFGFLLGFGFVPIYVYYFLADKDRIANHWHELVPLRQSRFRDEVVSVLTEINISLVSYFRGQIIVAACNGLLTFIGLWIIGIPYSLILGIITGALSIVPFLGIIASIIPALLLGFLSAKDDPTLQWLRPVLVLGVFALVQMTESMFITPRVQSHSTGLHPLAIILGILFWSMLLPGLLGPVVAVPLTCALVVLLRRYVWLDKKTS